MRIKIAYELETGDKIRFRKKDMTRELFHREIVEISHNSINGSYHVKFKDGSREYPCYMRFEVD